MPQIRALDHLVLTATDIQATVAFYRDALGMRPESFTGGDGTPRWALHFGGQKINLHPVDAPIVPKAARPQTGSADLCFLCDMPVDEVRAHLARLDVPVEVGPVQRSGAQGPLLSIYFRDPDGNLIELSNPL